MSTYSISDIVAQSFVSIDFPAQYVATMKTPGLENVRIIKFYDAFCNKNGIARCGDSNVIFTPAVVLGHLYTTFLLPQQHIFNSLPETEIDANTWGIDIKRGECRTLRHIARRLRNALGHNHFTVTKSMAFTFWDARPPANQIEGAEVIYAFDFDSLMFKFLSEWKKVIVPALIGQQGDSPNPHSPSAPGAGGR